MHIPTMMNIIFDDILDNCDVSPLAKQHRLKFPTSSSKTKTIFHMLHGDVWGLYKRSAYNKYYIMTIVDNYSRYTLNCTLQVKYKVIVVLTEFPVLISNQFGNFVNVLITDNEIKLYYSQLNKLFIESFIKVDGFIN